MKILTNYNNLIANRNFLKQNKNKTSQNMTNSIAENNSQPRVFAYQDYNISFTGRTPEDFYAQDFNRNNMPSSMKNFLFYDYEQRQHIPPEQMMNEVFKRLNSAKDFEDVKKLYPNEELFKNLHNANKKSRTGILSEINLVKNMSDVPLLKDGSDDFGMYLLKKIYVQGKTLKEINKDFLEKDMSYIYKGLVTQPIDYSTTAAYGIKFPNIEFWKSFIASREEYKKFFLTLPKNMVDPNKVEAERISGKHSGTSSIGTSSQKVEPQKHVRKYAIKQYKKKLLANEFKNTNLGKDAIATTVRRKFSKDDPEASFIIKYLSPIMTVAADKIHLSEQERLFAEIEKESGQQGNGKSMLERFWKRNPQLKEHFSMAITDTIEMFEEYYGDGGFIPINSGYQKVGASVTNQKVIDNVSPEFKALLDYVQTIEQKRQDKYNEHEILQKQWEQHFLDRYGEPTVGNNNSINVKAPERKLTDDEKFELEAKNLNAEIFHLNTIDGSNVRVAANLEKLYSEYLQKESELFPSKFADDYVKFMKNNPRVNKKYKLSIVTNNINHILDDKRVMKQEDLEHLTVSLKRAFYFENSDNSMAATFAMADILSRHIQASWTKNTYDLYPDDFIMLSRDTEQGKQILETIKSHKQELNKKYEHYRRPFTEAERKKVVEVVMDELRKYTGEGSNEPDDIKEFLLMLKESNLPYADKTKELQGFIDILIKNCSYTKFILDDNLSDEHRRARFERIMNPLVRTIMTDNDTLIISHVLKWDVINRHKHNITDELARNLLSSVPQRDYINQPMNSFGL